MNRWRTLTWWHGSRTSDSIADLWSVSLTAQDPGIPNLPLETPAAGGGVTGTLSATLGTLILAGTAAIAISGSAGPTLGALTLSATATVAVSGTGAPTLGALTEAGTGLVAVSGTGVTYPLGDLTVSGSGSTTISTVRRYYRGRPRRLGAVILSKNFYYVDEDA